MNLLRIHLPSEVVIDCQGQSCALSGVLVMVTILATTVVVSGENHLRMTLKGNIHYLSPVFAK